MSKRTQTSASRSWWATPESAVWPLLRCLEPGTVFVEPCAGDGQLVRILESHGHICAYSCDLDPRHDSVTWDDATLVIPESGEIVVTNPPFEERLLTPLLSHWLRCKSQVWLLLPSDLLMNHWFSPYAHAVWCIAPIGRVSWLGNGKGGMENSAWVSFDFAATTPGPLLPRLKTHRPKAPRSRP